MRSDTASPHCRDRLALIYLARGADSDHRSQFQRFLRSYRLFDADEPHRLVIIFKGFDSAAHLAEGREIFREVEYEPVLASDHNFDLGAYIAASRQISDERVCFLNTNSEIICDGWLKKLSVNFNAPEVGLVGATGSFESLPSLPKFPNPHIRSNAFMIRRELFLDLLTNVQLTSKWAAYTAESGPRSITQQVFERGLQVLIVGRNGRGYPPAWWPHSQTFRQGSQANLLVHDNVTRVYENLPFNEKMGISQRTWGEFLSRDKHL